MANHELIPDNWSPDGTMRGSQVSEIERRYTSDVATVHASDNRRSIGGYAAKFNRYSDNLGGFIEQVDRSFFNKSRGDNWPDVVARYNHDDNMLLGTTGAGTLRLQVDDVGLLYDVDAPASRADVVELVDRGDVRKSSFAFRTLEDDWTVNDLGNTVRTLMSGMLVDVAPVNRPAYNDTSVGPRSLTAAVALRSLALKVSADVDEVIAVAESGELRRLLVVESGAPLARPKPRLSGQTAVASLLASKQDPWA